MRFLRVLFLSVCLFGLNAFAAEPELQKVLRELEDSMRSIQSMQTDFMQAKQLSMFNEPVLLKGSIYMQKPGRFAWCTKSPMEYSIVFEKDKARQWNGDTNKVETISFSAMPVLRMVSQQMQSWFYGSYGALLGQYDIQIESEDPLILKFTPLPQSPAYGMVRSVAIRLKKDKSYIESMRIEEQNGDTSKMDFENTVINAEIDPAVWKIQKRA